MTTIQALTTAFDRIARCSDMDKFDVLEAAGEFMLQVMEWPEHCEADFCKADACEALAEYYAAKARVCRCGKKTKALLS